MGLDLFSGLPNPLLSHHFAVLDFETTGLYPAMGDEIVEIGLVRLENGEVTRQYKRLVQPGRAMDPAAVQISGITPEMLKDQPTFDAVADEFTEQMRDAVIVAHNAEFDMGFIQYKLVRLGRPQLSNPVLDTLELARALGDSGPYTLGILATRLGVDVEGLHAHRALDDAIMASRVLLNLLEDLHRRGQDDLVKLPGYRKSYQFSIDGHRRGEDNSFKMVVEHVRQAIEDQVDLEIAYEGGKNRGRRRITPREIKGMHVRAHCHVRKEDRDFRLDRILECEPVSPAPESPSVQPNS